MDPGVYPPNLHTVFNKFRPGILPLPWSLEFADDFPSAFQNHGGPCRIPIQPKPANATKARMSTGIESLQCFNYCLKVQPETQ
jgi:hypothetical protein